MGRIDWIDIRERHPDAPLVLLKAGNWYFIHSMWSREKNAVVHLSETERWTDGHFRIEDVTHWAILRDE